MRKTFILLIFFGGFVFSQNSSETQLSNLSSIDSGLTIGGYGEITYNDPSDDVSEIDVQRLVLLFAYKFDDRVSFVTEIEFEHVKEVYVEQAFLNYALNENLNLRGGLMLIPLGIINEYHEPTTFNGVERPSIDGKIIPSTWREIGFGFYGKSNALSLRYQAYIVNGPISYDGDYKLRGSDLIRKGRQKGAESVGSNGNFTAKIDYYGLPGLKLGLGYYSGKTQTTDQSIDASQVGLSMVAFDARYVKNRFSARAQLVSASLSDTGKYNLSSGKDLGSKASGYYVEGAFNLLPLENNQKLDLFLRYEDYNTHKSTEDSLIVNKDFHRKETTFGFSYHLSRGTVFKMDYQSKRTLLDDDYGQFNMGLGVFF